MNHVIYALCEPDGGNIRYIGYTSNAKARYQNHLSPSILKRKSHRTDWIKSVLAKGKKPEMIIVCEYELAEELPMAEKVWVANYRILGCDLVNGTDGGDKPPVGISMLGKHHSEETKLKQYVKFAKLLHNLSDDKLSGAFSTLEMAQLHLRKINMKAFW